MARNFRLSLLLAAPLLLGSAGYSQQQASPAMRPAAAQTGAANITLDVVVTGKSGKVVSGLQERDFKLLDNNIPTTITSFNAVTGSSAPVEVLLVVDAVNVPYVGVSYMRGQIEKYLDANGGRLAFPTALAIFTDTGTEIQQGFSKDGNAEAKVLDHAAINLREINRSTGFWGATERLQVSIAAMRSLIAREAAHPGRKLIVWISPGWPLLSGPEMQLDAKQEKAIFADAVGLSTAMRQGGITLYDVDPIGAVEDVGRTFYYENFLKGVSSPGQADPADLSLQVLSAQSGGLVLTSSNDLIGELQRCVADGTAYYDVRFAATASEQRDQHHSLGVKMAEPGLTARTWTGYYAQP